MDIADTILRGVQKMPQIYIIFFTSFSNKYKRDQDPIQQTIFSVNSRYAKILSIIIGYNWSCDIFKPIRTTKILP